MSNTTIANSADKELKVKKPDSVERANPTDKDSKTPSGVTPGMAIGGGYRCALKKILKTIAGPIVGISTVLGVIRGCVKDYKEERAEKARIQIEEEQRRLRCLPNVISEKYKQSIVTIKAEGMEATGFIAECDKKKYVYTARHVVMDRHAAVEDGLAFTIKKDIEVRSFCNDIVPIDDNCECAMTDGGNVRGAPWVDAVRFATNTELPALHLSEDPLHLGDEIIVVGYRLPLDGLSVETGNVTTAQSPQGLYLIHNAKTAKGFSGGPIFDSKGNVVAMEACEPEELDNNGAVKDVNKFGVRLSVCKWGRSGEGPVSICRSGRFFVDREHGILKWEDYRGQIYRYNCGIWHVPEDKVKKFIRTYALTVTHKEDGSADYTLDFRAGGENARKPSSDRWKISDIDVNTPIDGNVVSVLADCFYFGLGGCGTNVVLASKLYKVAAEKGDPMAKYNIGVCYAKGYGVDKDELMAFKFFQDSALKDVAIAKCALAECYFYGRGCKKDENQERYWLEEAANQNFSVAELSLGMYCLRNGEDDDAIRYFNNARQRGLPDALFALGQCYEFGIGVECDLDQADELYQEAEKNGSVLAIGALGLRYLKKGDLGNAIRLIEKGAGLGDPSSSILLGDCYLNGLGVKKDPVRAFDIYRTVASSGDPVGLYTLGCCHVNGIGTKTNYIEAAKVFQKASEFLFPPALYELGGCYSEGLGVESNEVKAVELYQKAADRDFAPAQGELGWCYAHGFGVLSNATKAVEWYRRAADRGFPPAQYELGRCYAEGIGVETNVQKAVEYYQKAAQGGFKEAIEAVKRIETTTKRDGVKSLE